MIKALLPQGLLLKLHWKWRSTERKHAILIATFDTPDGEAQHAFVNTGWAKENPALQFLAGMGYRPSDIEGTVYDASDDYRTVTLAPGPSGAWGVHQLVLDEGRATLEQADWFEPVESAIEASRNV